MCGQSPAPNPIGGCPGQCESCANGICVILCDEQGECNTGVQCPGGYACEVQCTGVDACRGTTIQCPAGHECNVACDAEHACRESEIFCGNLGVCNVLCNELTSFHPCHTTTIHCGPNECNVNCTAYDAKAPTIIEYTPLECPGTLTAACFG